jgi:hypothetical protein
VWHRVARALALERGTRVVDVVGAPRGRPDLSAAARARCKFLELPHTQTRRVGFVPPGRGARRTYGADAHALVPLSAHACDGE